MTKGREVRSFDYVNHPYRTVRDALAEDPVEVFRSATQAVASRVGSLAAELRVNLAGIQVGAEIDVTVGEVEEIDRGPTSAPATRIPLSWEAAQHRRLFPLMNAVLRVYPLTATETQLDFEGEYDPPLGLLGDAVDAAVGHRIAEASVHRFVTDVAHYLRAQLAEE